MGIASSARVRGVQDTGRHVPAYYALLLAGIAVWIAAALATSADPALHDQLPATALTLSSGLFLVAGVLQLATWRLTEQPRAARSALACVVLGCAVPVAALAGPLLRGPDSLGGLAPGSCLPFVVVAVALLVPHDGAGQVLSRRYARVVTASGCAALAAVLLGREYLPAAWRSGAVLVAGVSIAVAWLFVAVRERARPGGWGAVPFVLLSAAALVHALVLTAVGQHRGLAPGLHLAAAIVLVCRARSQVRRAHHRARSDTEHLSASLTQTRLQLADVERAERLRLHDARTAIAGVLGATELLAARDDEVDVDRLRTLIAQEVQRLHALLDVTSREPVAAFDLADALAPVVLVHQLDGRLIRAELSSLPVIGRSQATATVLDNLLRNAALHAPGAAVTVRTELSGDTATVVVEDDGPGIDAADRERLLEFAARGSGAHARGEGIGLYSSAAAIRAQGGVLHLGEAPGGGARVSFSLPIDTRVSIVTGAPASVAGERPTSRAS